MGSLNNDDSHDDTFSLWLQIFLIFMAFVIVCLGVLTWYKYYEIGLYGLAWFHLLQAGIMVVGLISIIRLDRL